MVMNCSFYHCCTHLTRSSSNSLVKRYKFLYNAVHSSFFAEAESWRRDREESMKCWEKEEEELLKLQDLVEWDENSMSAWGFFLLTQFEKFPFWRFYFGLCLWLKCFWGCNNFDFCWVFLKWNWICKNLSFNNLQNYN